MNNIPTLLYDYYNNLLNVDSIKKDFYGNVFLRKGNKTIKVKCNDKFGVTCPFCKTHDKWTVIIKVAGLFFGVSKIHLKKCTDCGYELTNDEYRQLDINQQQNRDNSQQQEIIEAAKKLNNL